MLRRSVDQALGPAEKRERRRARHVVFLGLHHRPVDNLGCTLERSVQECLVGLELMPGKDRAAAHHDREGKEQARKYGPELLAASAGLLGAAEDFVGVDAGETGDHLGEAEALAVAALT